MNENTGVPQVPARGGWWNHLTPVERVHVIGRLVLLLSITATVFGAALWWMLPGILMCLVGSTPLLHRAQLSLVAGFIVAAIALPASAYLGPWGHVAIFLGSIAVADQLLGVTALWQKGR